MNLIPCPFALGTSRADPNEVFPANMSVLPNRRHIRCQINGINYGNCKSDVKDRNFITIIFNKRTENVDICYEKPEFLAPLFDQEVIDESPEIVAVPKSSLTIAFGSAKRQKMARDMERSTDRSVAASDAVTLQRVAFGQSQLRAEAQLAGVDRKPTNLIPNSLNPNLETSQHLQLLPLHDTKTKDLNKVYPLETFCPLFCFQALSQEAADLASSDLDTRNEWIATKRYPTFIVNRLDYLPTDADLNSSTTLTVTPVSRRRSRSYSEPAVSRLQAASRLALLSHLFKLFQLGRRDLQKKIPLPGTPPQVARHILDMFTILMAKEGSERIKVRTMTPTLRDKLLYHIFILILHCDNFTTIIDDLAFDFKIPSARLKKYFAFVGCHFSNKVVSTDAEKSANGAGPCVRIYARLVAPVTFPSNKRGRP